MNTLLAEFYSSEGPERVGFILEDGSIVEVENVANDPVKGFDVCAEDLMVFAERAVASWHTHPGVKANLSNEDYSAFLGWSNLEHYVIGNDGIHQYVVTSDGQVTEAYVQTQNSPPREASRPL